VPTPPRLATFEAWLLQYGAILHKIARAYATPTDRDDLHQDLLLALWDALPFYRAESQPQTFIYRVALNRALNWTRTRRPHLPLPDLPAPTRNTDQLYAAIAQLPELDRSLILLHLDGLTYAEIAQVLGLTETNIGARLTRLRQRLKEMLT
jgi:RNA polymerase sigma-70 factor, ECF subfamily